MILKFCHHPKYAALGALLLSLPLMPGCGSGSTSSSPGAGIVPEAAILPLSEYTPFGPTGSIHVPYWKKYVKDSGADFDFVIELDGPVGIDGATIQFDLGGDAVPGVHYQLLSPSSLEFAAGDTQARITIDLIPTGQFFLERSLVLQLGDTTGVSLHEKSHRAELWIRPSEDPPVMSVAVDTQKTNPGENAVFTLSLSPVSQVPVTLHYDVDPLSDLDDYSMLPSGTMVFAPGQTQALIPISVGSSATSGEKLILRLAHERNGVRYVLPPLDQYLTSNTDLSSQDIHLDENMWTYSVGGVQEFEHHNAQNPPASGWAMPGSPTDTINGGSYWEPGMEDQPLVDLLTQADPDPILDPFSGVPLKIYSVAEAASGVMPYVRKSFNASFCGSTPQLYKLPEYARISYYMAFPKGVDAVRAVPFIRIGMRMRTLNLNHFVIFRIGSDGFDHAGNPVNVVSTSMGDIGVWNVGQVDPATDLYGVLEDAHGIRFWHAHRLDASHGWTLPGGGPAVFEVPGEVAGNPIEYPTWLSTADGSLTALGLSSIDEATGMGNLPYGFFWEISDDNSIYNGDLKPYFPKRGGWWEPQGNAVLTEATSLTVTVQ